MTRYRVRYTTGNYSGVMDVTAPDATAAIAKVRNTWLADEYKIEPTKGTKRPARKASAPRPLSE